MLFFRVLCVCVSNVRYAIKILINAHLKGLIFRVGKIFGRVVEVVIGRCGDIGGIPSFTKSGI